MAGSLSLYSHMLNAERSLMTGLDSVMVQTTSKNGRPKIFFGVIRALNRGVNGIATRTDQQALFTLLTMHTHVLS